MDQDFFITQIMSHLICIDVALAELTIIYQFLYKTSWNLKCSNEHLMPQEKKAKSVTRSLRQIQIETNLNLTHFLILFRRGLLQRCIWSQTQVGRSYLCNEESQAIEALSKGERKLLRLSETKSFKQNVSQHVFQLSAAIRFMC